MLYLRKKTHCYEKTSVLTEQANYANDSNEKHDECNGDDDDRRQDRMKI